MRAARPHRVMAHLWHSDAPSSVSDADLRLIMSFGGRKRNTTTSVDFIDNIVVFSYYVFD